ncbi:MAG: hypothetical protein HQM07_02155 [Zetaproteobacteria bacterium]|nr:hypothetical protein [Zetaproteobacteria bacterium]
MWETEPAKQSVQSRAEESAAPSRPALDVPPELRGQVEVPMANEISTKPVSTPASVIHSDDKNAVAGTAVSLDARVYDQSVAVVFSSVVDAMTALNLPVQSVDSPSGTITTDWIRDNANNPNAGIGAAMSGLFGDGVRGTRYRFVVRVLRLTTQAGETKTQLEIRTIGQAFISSHWVNRPIKRKVSNEMFQATEEQLAAAHAS